ncbi:hypothetical protein FKW77_003066 [Venturia effusa]|uniref:D-isomer specific 2-hydroxyacid dehydrogenase NAD-binding domain-containing protein n=1 Tax=Venturia effusa TaxID=50376 RepID=A0A517LNN9_9PEZI|nr:hypothetical protein FKW77_003066 [Venturia effusa]
MESYHIEIVALEAKFCPIPDFELPSPYTFDLVSYAETAQADVPARVKNATVVITTTMPLDAKALSPEVSPKLQHITVMASGTDTIDLKACKARGITVSNCGGANTAAVSEHAIGLYFAARRKFVETQSAMQADEWMKRKTLIRILEDRDGKMPLTCVDEVMGMIGYGVIGQRIAELAQLLGMKVLVAERKGSVSCRKGRVPFEQVLRKSTVLVVIIPRTSETLNLISTRELDAMKHSAVIVNVSRGGVVDEVALLKALQDGKIAGAGNDVFSTEPAGIENNVLLGTGARNLNLTLTPHAAWLSNTTMENLQSIAKQNVEGFCQGTPINVVC